MSITAFLPIIGTVIDKLFPDPAKAAEAKLKLAELEQKGELAHLDADVKIAAGQLAINLEEAKSANWFVSGWRPFVGWGCGIGFIYVAVLEPLLRFIAQVVFGYSGTFPVIDTSLTMQVLLGLLGLAGMRSWEKKQEVART